MLNGDVRTYKILTGATPESVVGQVLHLLDSGWQPLGGVSAAKNEFRMEYAQAVVKRLKPEAERLKDLAASISFHERECIKRECSRCGYEWREAVVGKELKEPDLLSASELNVINIVPQAEPFQIINRGNEDIKVYTGTGEVVILGPNDSQVFSESKSVPEDEKR